MKEQSSAPDEVPGRSTIDEIEGIARRVLAKERPGQTLDASALVSEVYLRLRKQGMLDLDRPRLLGLVSREMRRILVEYARYRNRWKRGGRNKVVTLPSAGIADRDNPLDLLIIDDELRRFAEIDENAARVVESRVFGGMTNTEIATYLGVSRRTVDTLWKKACAWLKPKLRGTGEI